MAKALTGLEYLAAPENFRIAPVVAIFGDEAFLVREVSRKIRCLILPEKDAEFSFSSYDCSRQARTASSGSPLTWTRIQKELETLAMFGGNTRIVQLESADTFLTEYRSQMEKYIKTPSENGVLILLLNALAANTNFYKLVAQSGLLVDCRPVPAESVPNWLIHWGKKKHKISLDLQAAELLADRVGSDLGFLDQELSRLALLVTDKQRITADFIDKNVGNWRARKVWDLVDAAFFGSPDKALLLLDQLLASGETAVGILAQMAATIRKFASATRIFLDAEKNGQRIPLSIILGKAGFQNWLIPKAEIQMKKLGRVRGEKLLKRLIDADLALKGDSQASPRLILERFIVYLAHPLCR